MKKLFIKTHGCQMNFYDSERMTDLLKPHGYELDNSAEDADLIVLNTCHIREKAVEKTFSELGRIRNQINLREEKTGKKSIVAVAGCVAQAQGKEIMKRSPWVDIVVGPQSYQSLPELIAKIDPIKKNKNINIDFPTIPKFDQLENQIFDRGPSAFLTIQEGCDKFCTFCVVPYTRGAEYSRPVKSIIDEAKKLIDKGVKEITLLGQNVNAWSAKSYDKDVWGLGKLISELAKIDDLQSIRYTTSHPLDMDIELLEAHKDIKKLMPYLHLPVQSGSDKILKLMNRKHTIEEYLNTFDRLKEINRRIQFSSDFIIAYPGEENQDFENTFNLIERVKFINSYSFIFSPRPGTVAENLRLIEKKISIERLEKIQNKLFENQIEMNQSLENSIVDVLCENLTDDKMKVFGRTEYMTSVIFNGNKSDIGKIVKVRIKKSNRNSLFGEIVSNSNQKVA